MSRSSPLPVPIRRLRAALVLLATLVALGAATFAILWHLFPLPDDFLASEPPGALVLDRDGDAILDVVGDDDQRRLPVAIDDVGPFIPRALVAAEDQDFHRHHGVDPGGIAGAFLENLRAGRVVRGGSTITMQVAGLRMNHPRTYAGKAVEAFRALQIEAAHKKERILEEWLNRAPFGGNLVGIEAASRAWLGKSAGECSLAESALLIGLPNAPERLRPDRHPEAATRRKALILDRMLQCDMITDAEHAEAMGQEIRIRTRTRSDNERHVGWMAIDRSGRGRVSAPRSMRSSSRSRRTWSPDIRPDCPRSSTSPWCSSNSSARASEPSSVRVIRAIRGTDG